MSFVGLRLFDDEEGQRRLIAYLKQGVVFLKPTPEDRKKEPGFYRMNWDPVDLAMDWDPAQHPRGQPENAGEFVKGGGGASTSGKAAKASQGAPEPSARQGGGGGVGRAPEAELARAMATAPVSVPPRSNVPRPGAEWLASPLGGATFVSPNIAEHLDFPTAVAGLGSRRQRILAKASKEIDAALGLTSVDHGAIGAWSDGAENSLMTEVSGGSWEQLRVAAAIKASLGDQKAVLAFQEAPGGKAALASFHATGSLADIHKHLLEDGVEFHTLIPTEGGATVYVADTTGEAIDAVTKAAERYGSEPVFQRGHAEFIGTQKQDGTDREQREDARRIYWGLVQASGVPGATALWQRIHNAYGQTLEENYTPDLVAQGDAPARYATKQWAGRYNAASGEDLIKDAERNQPGLVYMAKRIAGEIGDVEVLDPGVKGIERINEKIEGGKKPNQISDVPRLGFKVNLPEQAERIVSDLSKVFEVADEGWRLTDAGYFDKTLKLKFPNGQTGEVQIYPPGLFEAKKVGHKLYKQWRTSTDPVEKDRLEKQMASVYSPVRKSLPDQWNQVLQAA